MEVPPKNQISGLINMHNNIKEMKIKISHVLKPLLIILAISTIGMLSCVEEYWPELNSDYDNLLVVDGKITNEAGPYTIKLSHSSSLSEPSQNPLSDAIVIISDNEGNSETLSETSSGTYETSITGMQGVIGRMYKLSISTEGKTYESAFEELLAPVGVESVSHKEETHKVSETEEIYESGHQFYISTETATKNKSYFYWEIEETYEHHAPYPIGYIYNGTYDYLNKYGLPHPYEFNNPDSLYFCWTTDKVNIIFTQSTEYLNTPKVNELALHFIPLSDERLRIHYSLMAKQYVVSEKAYAFMKSLEDLNSNNDNLYASMPYQIRGNLVNTENPQETALGYFLTAGVSNSEHFFLPANVRPYEEYERWYMVEHEFELWAQAHCLYPAPDGFNKRLRYWEEIAISTPDDWPLYLTNVWAISSPPSKLLVVINKQPECVDCRTYGGTTQKPDFWID